VLGYYEIGKPPRSLNKKITFCFSSSAPETIALSSQGFDDAWNVPEFATTSVRHRSFNMPTAARSSFEVLVDYVQARIAKQDRVVADARSAGSPHDLHQATRSLVDLKGDLAWARSLLSSEEQRGKLFPS
jgi:hypothetical protein